MRDLLLFIHVFGAAGWIGGGLFGLFGLARLARAGGASNGRAMELIVEKASIYFGVMFVLVVGAGVALVVTEEQYGWEEPFIWIGIAAIVASGVWQGLVSSKSDERLMEAVKSESPHRIGVFRNWRRTAWVDVAILLIALWAMIAKPGF